MLLNIPILIKNRTETLLQQMRQSISRIKEKFNVTDRQGDEELIL